MNAVEIEQAITDLAQQPFDAQEFPFEFLRSFGNKETTIKRLRTGNTNRSDVGGVLQRNNIHIAVAEAGKTTEMNHPGNRGGCLVKVKQVPQPVLQVVDSNALRLRPAGCPQSIPAVAGG